MRLALRWWLIFSAVLIAAALSVCGGYLLGFGKGRLISYYSEMADLQTSTIGLVAMYEDCSRWSCPAPVQERLLSEIGVNLVRHQTLEVIVREAGVLDTLRIAWADVGRFRGHRLRSTDELKAHISGAGIVIKLP